MPDAPAGLGRRARALQVGPYLAPTPGTCRRLQAVELPEVLTIAEVARELRVSRSTVYALCARGRLKCFRVANAIRFLSKDLAGFTVR